MRTGVVRHGMLGLVPSLLFFGAPELALGQQGRLRGQVTDVSSGAPVVTARVLLGGTTLIEATDQNGNYIFRSVPPGQYQVRVLRLGYAPQVQPVTIVAGDTATLNFAMTPAPVQLDEIVATATGEQRRLELGNAVSTIDAARVTEEAPITEVGNLISGRAAGVQVLKSGGTTGTGTRIRVRGSNSVSLSNEPLYYIDGIRMESSPTSLSIDIGGGIGGGATSRINDLNPEDIESIEIVKGPAAATLYGIQASNGVVRITTKRGRAGSPRWNFYVEAGAVDDHNEYPLNYNGRDTTAATGADYDGFCILQFELNGECTQTGISVYSPLEDPETRPLKAGFRQQYGANVSGGSDVVSYFLSGEFESEDGVFRLPEFEEDSIREARGSVPETQIRPNALERISARANVDARVAANTDLQASLGYTSSDTRLVENDNSFLTITGSGEASGNPPDVNRGWYFIPAELFAATNTQEIERFTGGLTANWRPRSWLTTRATVGYDLTNRSDVQFFPTGQVADYLTNRLGARTNNKFQLSQTSVDLGASARFALSPSLGSRTSVGAQFFRDLTSGTAATGRGLAPGSKTITGASTTESSDTTVESRSIGSYVEQELSFNDRLFVTGALRFDDNSAFGENFDATVYPKASVSWLVSDEPFYRIGFMNTFRLRAAYGASGQQPGTIDALRFFRPIAGRRAGIAETGVSLASLGNPDLKPERSRELELGFDAGFLDGRLSFELTYYTKTTTDALIERDIAPSLGGPQSQFFNLGEVRNRGLELGINTRLIDRPNFIWDLTLSGSRTSNKLIELGEGVEPIIFGFGLQRHVEGYPLGGYWARPILGYADANGNGIIETGEVTVGDTAVFAGPALPNREAALNTSVTLFNGRVRVSSQFDHRGGHKLDNAIESFRCTPVLNCRGLVDRTAPLAEQARAQAVYSEATEWGFYEDASFIKLRELAVTFFAPDTWAQAFRASRVSLTLAGRNLATWTDYTGVDPEVNAFGQSNFATSDFESQPQVRVWTARLNLSF